MFRLLLLLFVSVTALHSQIEFKPKWQQMYQRHGGKDAFYSEDGSSIITCGPNGFSFWDTKTGAHKSSISIVENLKNIGPDPVSYFCFSDSLIVICVKSSNHDTIEVWNYHTSKHLYSLPLTGNGKVTFDKSGKYLAISMQGRIEIREPYSGAVIQTLNHEVYGYMFLSFSPDAAFLIASIYPPTEGINYLKSSSLWNIKEGTLVQHVDIQADTSDFPLSFSEKENILAYYSKKKSSIIFRNISTNELAGEIPTEGTVVNVGVPEKYNCITQESDASIVLWDIRNGKSIIKFSGLERKPQCIRFNADTSLVTATDGSNICIWDIKTADLIKKITANAGKYVRACALFSGTDVLISQGIEAHVFDWAKGTTKNVLMPNKYIIITPAYNEVKGEIITLSDQIVERRKLHTGELISTLPINIDNSGEVFVLLSGSGEYTLKLREIDDNTYNYSIVDVEQGVKKWNITTERLQAFCVNNHNNKIAIAKDDTIITIYDTSGVILRKIDNKPLQVLNMFFDEEGNYLYVVGSDRIRKWDVKTGNLLMEKVSVGLYFQSFFNEKTGKFVTIDTTFLSVWDINTGELLNTIENHRKRFVVQLSRTDNNILIYDRDKYTTDVIDIGTGKTLFSIKDTNATFVEYGADGKLIFLSGTYKKPEIVDARNGKHIGYLTGLNGERVFYPVIKDRYVASVVERGQLALWDLNDLQTTSVENENTMHDVGNDQITFYNTDNELKIIVNKGLNQAQSYTVYNVCGKKIQSGYISSSTNEFTVPYDAYQSGVYYFECTLNGHRYVHQFAVIR